VPVEKQKMNVVFILADDRRRDYLWGNLVETMSKFYFGSNVKEHHKLFAILQTQVDMNPYKI